MNVKRSVIIVAVAASLCLAGLGFASAKGWGGGYGSYGCQGPGFGPGYQQLDDATKAKVDTFAEDTRELRKQMAMKMAERAAIMNAETPDPAAAAKIAGEMFDLHTQIHDMAQTAGVPVMGGYGMMGRQQMGPGNRQGRGKGPGFGRSDRPCFSSQTRWN